MWNSLAEISDSKDPPVEADILKKTKNISVKSILGKEVNFFSYLPKDIVFDILVKVEARHLQVNVKLVCKAWRRMISARLFISENALQVKPTLWVQGIISFESPQFEITEMEVEEQPLCYRISHPGLGQSHYISSSCNGLLLVCDWRKVGVLEVTNLVTQCSLKLPKCPSGCIHIDCGSALGFDPRTKKYKVVHVFDDTFGFEIFTIGGSDKDWKRVCGPWKEPNERPFNDDFCWTNPILINERFLHWYVSSDEYILSMDISDEKLVKIRLPGNRKEIDRYKYWLMEFDGKLSLVHIASDTQVDVWILEDFHGQVWFKKHSILAGLTKYVISEASSWCSKRENAFPKFSRLVPLGSARNGEVLMFKRSPDPDYRFYMYSTKRREMKKFLLTIKNLQPFVPHRRTLHHLKTFDEP